MMITLLLSLRKAMKCFLHFKEKVGDFITWINPIYHRNMIMVASGFGDGFYQSYIGYDENNDVCEIIVPMINPVYLRAEV